MLNIPAPIWMGLENIFSLPVGTDDERWFNACIAPRCEGWALESDGTRVSLTAEVGYNFCKHWQMKYVSGKASISIHIDRSGDTEEERLRFKTRISKYALGTNKEEQPLIQWQHFDVTDSIQTLFGNAIGEDMILTPRNLGQIAQSETCRLSEANYYAPDFLKLYDRAADMNEALVAQELYDEIMSIRHDQAI